MRNHHYRDSAGGAGVGLSIGFLSAIASAAATYYLFATEDGTKKREQMKDFMYETKDRITKSGNVLKDASSDMYHTMKTIMKDRYEDISNLNKEDAQELGAKIKERIKGIKEDIEDTLDHSGGRKTPIKM